MVGSIGFDNSWNYYSGTAVNSVNSVSPVTSYDYKSAQMETQLLLNGYGTSSTSVSELKADSAKFLTSYTSSMNNLYQSASALTGGNVDKLLYNKSGEITEDTIKKTVDAVQNMVDQYNSSLKLLNNNADRGSGVVKQIGRMSADPISAKGMEQLGVSVSKDATLKLDAEALTKSLTEAAEQSKNGATSQLSFLKDLIGGSNGLAEAVRKDARAGLSESSARLIGNDIAEIKAQQNSSFEALTGLSGGYSGFGGMGAYYFNNQAAVGLMMNMLV